MFKTFEAREVCGEYSLQCGGKGREKEEKGERRKVVGKRGEGKKGERKKEEREKGGR